MRAWLQERMPLANLAEWLAHKTVPLHDQAVWYYLGGIILLALAILVVTGVLLAAYYQPYVPENANLPGAHESVQRIINEIPHGWWIRSIHHWASHLMIVGLFLHLMSTLLLKAYRRPRELTWWSGLALFALTLTAGFTGYLLPWNSLSFAATRVGAGIAGATPLIGPLMRQVLLGGPDVSAWTLTRFFGLHVAVLPLLIAITVGIHVLLAFYHGSSVPPSIQQGRDSGIGPPLMPFWPHFVYREARVWLLVFIGLMVVAFLFPPAGGTRADPLAPTAEGIKPEWYFLGFYKILKLLPAHALGLENLQLGVLSLAIVGVLLVVLPVLDVPPGPGATARRRHRVRRRVLLLSSAVLGWVATMLPISLILAERRPTVSLPTWPTAAVIVPVLLPVLWLTLVVMMDLASTRRPQAPATLWGVVLVSAIVGYTLWEGFGGYAALGAVAGLGALLLIIAASRHHRAGSSSRPARLAAGLLLLAALLTVIPLGRGPGHAAESGATIHATALDTAPVAPARRTESGGRFAAILVLSALLLIAVEYRIRHQRRLSAMGLYDQPAIEAPAERTTGGGTP